MSSQVRSGEDMSLALSRGKSHTEFSQTSQLQGRFLNLSPYTPQSICSQLSQSQSIRSHGPLINCKHCRVSNERFPGHRKESQWCYHQVQRGSSDPPGYSYRDKKHHLLFCRSFRPHCWAARIRYTVEPFWTARFLVFSMLPLRAALSPYHVLRKRSASLS